MVEYRRARLDAVYAAIAHPVRRDVLEKLRTRESRITDLAAPFSISLAAISKHIQVLEEAGLVERTVHGREHRLSLNLAALLPAARWIDSYTAFWEERLDALEAKLRVRSSA